MPSLSGFFNKKDDSHSPAEHSDHQSAGHPSSSAPSQSEHPKSTFDPHLSLYTQHPTPATTSTKIKIAILSTALIDALGFGNEFSKRFSVPFLDKMTPNPGFEGIVPAGSWTDDSSMMLCLAMSIIETYPKMNGDNEGEVRGVDKADQLSKYLKWKEEGYMGSVPSEGCFDIGNQVSRALYYLASAQGSTGSPSPTASAIALQLIQDELSQPKNSGNGSLMRVLPIGLVYWRNLSQAKVAAKLSSETTHPNQMCTEVCQVWTCLIARVMQEMGDIGKNHAQGSESRQQKKRLSKLDLLETLAEFPFTNEKLKEALAMPAAAKETQPKSTESSTDLETWYQTHHPLLKLISSTQSPTQPSHYPSRWTPPAQFLFPYIIPPAHRLSSSGYVFNTLIAALYCFFATGSFEHGALMAINLCDDADTVGAIYAGLAAVWYGCEENDKDSASKAFWTPKMKEWKKEAKSLKTVLQVADGLVRVDNEMGKEATYWARITG